MRQFLSIISVIFLITGNLAHAEVKSVRIALPSWEGGQFIAYDLGKKIKESLGISIEYIEIEGDPMWVELDKDHGQIDIFPDLWMPNQEKNWKEFIVERKTVVSNKTPYIGKQGFYVINAPKWARYLNINDFQKSNIINYFDENKNNLADYWPGAPGWHATIFSQVKIKSYNLNKKAEELKLDNNEFLTLLDKKHQDGSSLLFYYWEPDWIHAKYNISLVNEKAYEDGCRKIVDPTEDDDWLSLSKFSCAYPESEVWIVFRDEFLAEDTMKNLLLDYEVKIDDLQSALLKSKEEGIPLIDIVNSR